MCTAGNKLTALPAAVSKLTRLRSLVLDGNPLTTLPVADVLAQPHLRMLSVTGTALPESVKEQLRSSLWAKGGMLCE